MECVKIHTHVYVTLRTCDVSKRCVVGDEAKYHDVCMTRKTLSNSLFFVCGFVFPDEGGSGQHRNMLECSLTVQGCTRAVENVSSHFEYLENRSRSLDVTWQPFRGDLTAHP